MASILLNFNTAAIVLFGGAIAAILFNWLVLTDDRERYRDFVGSGSLWGWMAFSGALYIGDAYGMGGGFEGGGFGADGFGGDGGFGGGDGGGGGCGGV
jgi:hypothetical protein